MLKLYSKFSNNHIWHIINTKYVNLINLILFYIISFEFSHILCKRKAYKPILAR